MTAYGDHVDDPIRTPVLVIECTIPPAMTIDEWRRRRTAPARGPTEFVVTRLWDRLRQRVRR